MNLDVRRFTRRFGASPERLSDLMKWKLQAGPVGDKHFDRYIAFRLGEPHRGYLGQIERSVGTYTIVGRPAHPRLGVIHGLERECLKRYRAVLDGLAAAAVITQTQAHVLGNCRPAGFHAKPRLRMCGMSHICPHCASRQAADYWAKIDPALFPSPKGGERAPHATCDVVYALRRLGPGDIRRYKNSLQDVLTARLSDRRFAGPQLLGSRGLETRRLRRGFIWMIEGLVVDVAYRKGRPFGWKMAVRQLFAVPTGAAFEVPGSVTRRLVTPTRRQVARAVVKLCRYPRGLLVADDGSPTPARVVNSYLHWTHRRRLWAVCRGKVASAAGQLAFA